jgi:hypothetical protein
MSSTSANVVIFGFREPARAPRVIAAARDQTGVRSVALVGFLPDSEIRIVGGVGAPVPEARWLALALAVLDVLSAPLRVLAGSTPETPPVTLPDSEDGVATFGRLIPQGELVILAAVCDEHASAIGVFDRGLGKALFEIPADCAIRLSSQDRQRVYVSTSSAGQSSRDSARVRPSRIASNAERGNDSDLDEMRFNRSLMGPRIQASIELTKATGRPAAIGALSDASDVFAGRAGTTACPSSTNELTRVGS